jgi:hypothetical protein
MTSPATTTRIPRTPWSVTTSPRKTTANRPAQTGRVLTVALLMLAPTRWTPV